jgi:hypothetical protein
MSTSSLIIEYAFLGIGLASVVTSYYHWNKTYFLLGGILIITSMLVQLFSSNENKKYIVGILLGSGLAFSVWGVIKAKTIFLPGSEFIKTRKGKQLSIRERKIIQQFMKQRQKLGINYTSDLKNALR